MIICLTGFMGCGKSSVGRRLSELLCCPFIDLDSVIEEAAGRTIPEIFASEGEAGFRRMEVETLISVISAGCQEKVPKQSLPSQAMGPSLCGQRGSTVSELSPDSHTLNNNSCHLTGSHLPTDRDCDAIVLALGGGTVMTAECAEMVHGKTLCIYLRAKAGTLAERLAGEADGRPMLSGSSLQGAERRDGLMDRIHNLMDLRSETYESTAHMIMDTDGKTIDDVAAEIVQALSVPSDILTSAVSR